MTKSIIKYFSLAFLSLALAAILVPHLVFSQVNTPDGGYQLPHNTNSPMAITVPFSDASRACKVLNTNTVKTFFVPTKLPETEWYSFVNHTPSGVSAGCCPDTYCQSALGETYSTCWPDCHTYYCGNHICESNNPTLGQETTTNCDYDCGLGACLKNSDLIGWLAMCPSFTSYDNCDAVHCLWSGSTCSPRWELPSPQTCWAKTTSTNCNAITGCIWSASSHRNYWWCGDGSCQGTINENTTSCPWDCGGTWCGDTICNGAENSSTCLGDCPIPPVCGNLLCQPGEDCCTCSTDCGVCANSCQGPLGCEEYNKMALCDVVDGCYWGVAVCN